MQENYLYMRIVNHFLYAFKFGIAVYKPMPNGGYRLIEGCLKIGDNIIDRARRLAHRQIVIRLKAKRKLGVIM